MIALQGHTDASLAAAVPGLDPAHARKIISSVHREREIGNRPGLPQRAVDAVLAVAGEPRLAVIDASESPVDRFGKYLLATGDGQKIETVRIPLDRPGRVSVCVSSQVGCALACAFCATGRLGLARNLESWEIVEQVRVVRRGLPADTRVHGVVFQGMGEPMANLDRVLAAIEVMTAPYALAIDARAITVCTAGLPHGIRRLAREAPKVRLGLSIGSARPEVRGELMPIARSHPLPEVIDAAAEHTRLTGLAPMWAVTLLAGVNDSDDDARALAALAADFRDRTGRRPRITVLDYNRIDDDDADPFRRAAPDRAAAFSAILSSAGLGCHRRYSGGHDIAAACGQLAATGG